MSKVFSQINFTEMASVFIVLFAVIDIIGAVPIVVSLRQSGKNVEPFKTFIISLAIFVVFLFFGEGLLSFLNVDVHSFAVAGAIILFLLAIEMIFGIVFFKDDSPRGAGTSQSTLVPLVFPLIAGAAALTTLLSFRSLYAMVNILLATLANLLIVWLVLAHIDKVEKLFGQEGIYVMRKFFGVILMAMAVKLLTDNILILIELAQQV